MEVYIGFNCMPHGVGTCMPHGVGRDSFTFTKQSEESHKVKNHP